MAVETEASRARTFARQYTSFVEALLQQGATQKVAREEGFKAALVMLVRADQQKAYDPALGPCPTCGNG